MKKRLLLFVFSLLVVAVGYSQQRSEADASKIAGSFLKEISGSKLKSGSPLPGNISLSYKCTNNTSLRSAKENVYYYVFNIDADNGFIIVSGDERAKDVLGYSENGGFDIDNIPASFHYWLSCYQEELEQLALQPLNDSLTFFETANIDATRAAQSYASSISPLLGNIKWDQGAPYNNLCPNDNTANISVTGCVATGMAQVMRYHKWPEQGTGSYSYTPASVGHVISANFGATTYDWENMSETYTGSETEDQKNAVATLMYHCGVAVSMDYTSGESGANSYSIPNALSTYFGYDPNMKAYVRESYTKAEWMDFIKIELNASRPVLYSGRSDGGGHLFVCDGYDSNNKFHFNWGWSGSSNGYFEITALNPSSLGIGGGTGGGYNSSQAIFTGVQKPTGAADNSSYEIIHKGALKVSESQIARNGTFTITAGTCGNFGVRPFTGKIGLMLTTESGEPVQILGQFGLGTISAGSAYGVNGPLSIPGISINQAVSNGNYRIYFGYWEEGTAADNWKITETRNAAPGYVNVTVASDKITFSSPTEGLPKLTVNTFEVIGKLYEGKTGQFKISITNNGGEYLDSYIAVYMQNYSNTSVSSFITSDKYFIGTGETKEFTLTGTIPFAAGNPSGDNYIVALMYDPTNSGSGSLSSLPEIISEQPVLAAPVVNTVKLELTSHISFPDKDNVTPSTFNLKVDLKNTADYYDGEVYIAYHEGNGSYRFYDYQPVILEPNEEKTIYFTNAPDVSFGEQSVGILYYNPLTNTAGWIIKYGEERESATLAYTFKDNITTGVEEEQIKATGNVNIYPNPATDYISFQSDEVVKSVRIVSLTGQTVISVKPETSGTLTIPVANISSGTYIIQIETNTNIRTSKFIKK